MRKIYQKNLVVQFFQRPNAVVKLLSKTVLLTVLFAFMAVSGFSQTDKFWSANAGRVTSTAKAVARLSFPKEFKQFSLNLPGLKQQLFTIVANQSRHTTVISLPNAEGQLEQFEMVEASNFEPALQSRFPQIRAFSGKGITDKAATLKLSISPEGISTMVFRTDKDNEFIEPYSADHTVYAVYRSQRNKGALPWSCTTDDHQMFESMKGSVGQPNNGTNSNAGELKTMRLAQSCNGEYANYFNAFSPADEALVLAAFNRTLTRCNGVYEKDLALHLNLIPQTTAVIYYDPATDPYSTTLSQWNAQLQNALNANVGAANYDIGHMFGASGGGGNAGCIGCVCNDANKGSGITSPADGIPEGDNFDIDYVVHEVGHQLGGNHTFSHANEGSGVNKEVGSGITIMGYAGITAHDVAPHSIDIFHEASIQQIQVNLATKTCPVTTNISATNATPVIAPLTNYTIPMSTPFQLTGSATDANGGDVLTYCWEQNDDGAGQTATNSRARENKPSGPNWLSFPATTSPTRTFPRLSTVLAGGFTTGPLAGGDAGVLIEALSNVGRTLNFRLTVRDNSVYSSTPPLKVGQTAFSDMTITVTTTSGPFMVTAPNTNVSWPANSSQTITWDVANSTAAPVSCANVRILLSTDGGQTFPTVLVASTPNDGSEPVTIPTVPGLPNTTARVKIEGIGNVFFDISNTNFTISPAVSGFSLTTPAATNVACPAPATAVATLATTSNGGYTTPIVLSATAGVPAGTTVTFGTNPVTPGNSSTVTLNNANTLASGTYNVTVTGVSGAITQTVTVSFVVAAGTAPTVTAPAATAVCAGSPASFTVTTSGAAATGFQWQVSTDLGVTYTNIAGATTATYTIAATTAAQNNNRYRVIVTGQCGTATSAAAILTVNAAPVITAQPQNTTVCAGTAATFSVTATGAGLSYQWQLSTDAGVTYNNVAGATSASITVPAVTAAQQGHRYRVIVSGTCAPAVTSAAGILSVGDAAAITGQPAPVVTCAGSNATFSVTATGSSLTYQWQVSTDAGVTYTNIAGATAASYTITGVTAAQNGNLFRVTVFSCTPTGITSNSALLTVNIPVAIGTQPASAAVCEGTAVSFTAAATGTAVTYQWQVSTNNGTTWTNIAGATSATYSIASPTAALSGNQYRVVVSGTCNPAGVNSTAATLTVNTAVVITSQPANVAVCIPTTTTASFSVAATGTALTYQWQVSTNSGTSFTNIAGATTNTLNLTGVTTTMNGNQYRVVVSGTCNPAGVNSAAATLTVNSLVSITQQPRSVSICTGSNAVFSVVASGSTITYDWQVSINNSPFASVTNGAPYSGATTSTLTITNPSVSFNGYRYRVVVSGVPCGSRISDTVTLTVNVLPSVVLTASQFATITPYTPTTVNATVSPNGNYLYSWTLNGAILGNIGSSSLPVTVDETGTYQVTATNVQTGCSGRSNSVSVTARESGDVFIYPNPSSGLFQVRYFSTTAGLPQSSMLNIYDSKGARVAVNMYTATINYGRIDVDMTRMSAGVYHIELKDASGKRIVSGKAIIAK